MTEEPLVHMPTWVLCQSQPTSSKSPGTLCRSNRKPDHPVAALENSGDPVPKVLSSPPMIAVTMPACAWHAAASAASTGPISFRVSRGVIVDGLLAISQPN
jgi:hypothetical protein